MNIFDAHIHSEVDNINPDAIIERMNSVGIEGGVVFSPDPQSPLGGGYSYEKRMECLEKWTKNYTDRFFPVLFIHPLEEDAIEKAKDAVKKGIMGFKIICDCFYVYDEPCIELLKEIAKMDKPVFFHSGILWIGNAVAGEYNKPIHWEHLLNMPGLRFSMAHCSWPWYDECIALYGRMMAAYRTSPSGAPEMYFDLTPGTPEIYREDLFSKLFRIGYDVPHNTMFGADMSAEEYDSEYTKGWLALDNSLYDKLGIAEETRELIYEKNFLEFMGVAERTHKPRPRWKISDKV